jgi:hypothetical protein
VRELAHPFHSLRGRLEDCVEGGLASSQWGLGLTWTLVQTSQKLRQGRHCSSLFGRSSVTRYCFTSLPTAPGWMSDYTLGPELKPTTTIEGVCERRGVALPNECASHYGSDMCARRDATTRARGTLTINHLEARTPRSSASSKCHLLRLRDFAQQLHPSTACCAEPPQEGGNAARKCARPRK